MVEIISKIVKQLKETDYSLFCGENTSKEEAKKQAEETISYAIHSFTNYAYCVAHMQRMIQAVADLDKIAEQYIGEPLCDSSDINVVKKFVLEFFNDAYKKDKS